MLTAKMFKHTDIKCADNYIMLSTYTCESAELIEIIEKHGVLEIILSPAKNTMRITLKKPLNNDTNVITMERIELPFLQQLWGLSVPHMNKAIQTYINEGNTKSKEKVRVWKDGVWSEAGIDNKKLAMQAITKSKISN